MIDICSMEVRMRNGRSAEMIRRRHLRRKPGRRRWLYWLRRSQHLRRRLPCRSRPMNLRCPRMIYINLLGMTLWRRPGLSMAAATTQRRRRKAMARFILPKRNRFRRQMCRRRMPNLLKRKQSRGYQMKQVTAVKCMREKPIQFPTPYAQRRVLRKNTESTSGFPVARLLRT